MYDSISSSDLQARAKEQIAALIHTDEPQYILNFPPVQIQSGTADCGLFAIALAETICSGRYSSCFRYPPASLRCHHLLDCLNEGRVISFPSYERRCLKCKGQVVVNLYCKSSPESIHAGQLFIPLDST